MGIIVSIATGSNDEENVDVDLLSQWHLPLSPSFPRSKGKNKQTRHVVSNDNVTSDLRNKTTCPVETIPLR